jgi:hypothetical protein
VGGIGGCCGESYIPTSMLLLNTLRVVVKDWRRGRALEIVYLSEGLASSSDRLGACKKERLCGNRW